MTHNLVETAPRRISNHEDEFESRYRILLHNDDVTPYEYVIKILVFIFLLSEELAEHVAWTAHNEQTAIVVIRPRAEAERLVSVAHTRARLDGHPLTFSIEAE
jgi:ATP-dependent Clp protease adaptor protein ClpS